MVRVRKVKGRPLQILERENVENPVVKYADKRGVRHIKLNTPGRSGWPDRVFWIPGGRPLVIEFKRPDGGTVSRQQADNIAYLERMGYDVHVVEEVSRGIALLEERLEAAQVSKKGR